VTDSERIYNPGPPDSDSPHPLSVDLILLGVVLCWGLNFSALKFAISEVDQVVFNAVRYAAATLAVFALAWVLRAWQPMRRRDVFAAIALGLLGSCIYQLSFVWGLSKTTAGHSSVLVATAPIWVALVTGLRGERVNLRTWSGLGLAFLGVVLLVGGGDHGEAGGMETRQQLIGDLITVAAASCWGIYMALSRPILQRCSPVQFNAISMATGTLGLAIVATTRFTPDQAAQFARPVVLLLVLFSGVISIGLAQTIWSYGIKRTNAVYVGNYQNMVPLAAVVIAMFWFGEAWNLTQAAGGVVILAGVWVARHGQRRGSRQASRGDS
jgi:drug/metabolite transporter (DMT)-like permease